MALLEAKNITKRFGGLVAVSDLSLRVEKGEILGMIGPNGAGKTTAFNMISGYYPPNEGQVFFNGENITGLRPDQVCKKGLTRTFQVVKPFPHLSVLDNVMVGAYSHTGDNDDYLGDCTKPVFIVKNPCSISDYGYNRSCDRKSEPGEIVISQHR